MTTPEERRAQLASDLTVVGAFGVWLLIAGAIAVLDERSGTGRDALIWLGAIWIGHFLSLPGLMVVAVRLSDERPRPAVARGAAFATIHFLLGLALLIPALGLGGESLALAAGFVYLFTSGLWWRYAERVIARRASNDPPAPDTHLP